MFPWPITVHSLRIRVPKLIPLQVRPYPLFPRRPLLPLPSCDPCNCIVIALPGGCCFVWSFDMWDLIGTQYVGDLLVSLPNHCVRRKNAIVEYHISLVRHCELLQSGREGDLSLFLLFYHTSRACKLTRKVVYRK